MSSGYGKALLVFNNPSILTLEATLKVYCVRFSATRGSVYTAFYNRVDGYNCIGFILSEQEERKKEKLRQKPGANSMLFSEAYKLLPERHGHIHIHTLVPTATSAENTDAFKPGLSTGALQQLHVH